MARFIQAIRRYGPRILSGTTVRQDELVQQLTRATQLEPEPVHRLLDALRDTLRGNLAAGRPVILPGIGRFAIGTDGDGRLRLHLRAHHALRSQLATLDDFEGDVANRQNVGLEPEEYKDLWDAEHPEDPLDMPRLLEDCAD